MLSRDDVTFYMQVVSAPSYILRVNNDGQLSLTDGASSIVTTPPDIITGVMMYIQVLPIAIEA